MNDAQIPANVVALVILVLTTAANMLIQLVLIWDFLGPFLLLNMLPTVFMMLSLVELLSWGITVLPVKRSLESKYEQKHEEVGSREGDDDGGYMTMIKYWVMSQSGSPHFVTARSVVSAASAVICLLNFILLAVIYGVSFVNFGHLSLGRPESVYGRYSKWILVIQSFGVVVGTISPLFRCFVAARFKCSSIRNRESFQNEFKIEAYWVEVLLDWRDCYSALKIQQHKYMKFIYYNARWFAIAFFIKLQILCVLLSKLLLLLFALLHSRLSFFNEPIDQMVSNNEMGREFGLTHYVLLLEGEAELPRTILKNICEEADNVIQMGKKKQPKNLVNLLHKFHKFKGVGGFDSEQIPSLHSEEPQNTWMLPVITLTSIAVALPNIGKSEREQLLSSVGEGLSLVKIVEKTLVKNVEFVKIRKSANAAWVGVVLHMKWLDVDLTRMSRSCNNSKELVQELACKAEKTITEEKENPRKWRSEVVCWNSMYRICGTIMLLWDDEDGETDLGLFERLCTMIADILAACFTNLPRVMTTMCQCNVIEEREKRVGEAFALLGKTEGVVELVRQHEWPSLDRDKAAYIDEWRALFRRHKHTRATPSSTSVVTTTEEHIAVSLDC